MMTLPAFLFGCLIAVLLGSLFHFWKGGGFWHIVLFILFSLAGFWLGHFAATAFGLSLWNVGPIRFGPALGLSVVSLFAARWLFHFTPKENS